MTNIAHELPEAVTSPAQHFTRDENPRLRVQAKAVRTRRRHFKNALRRILTLTVLDVTGLILARETLHVIRSAPLVEPISGLLFPVGFLGGWGSVAAFVVGLALAGGYASEERWASSGAVIRGTAIGGALGLWQGIDVVGLWLTLGRWALVTTCLGIGLLGLRKLLAFFVLRYRIAAHPNNRVLFVGDEGSPSGKKAFSSITGRPGSVSLGWLSERGDADDYLGHPSAVWDVLSTLGVDTVVLCGELQDGMFDSIVEAAAVAGCRVLSIRNQVTVMASRPRRMRNGDAHMLELTFPANRAGQDALKRAFDVVISFGLLLLLSPLLLAITVMIKLDTAGPVVFVQERVGRAGKIFRMLKLRTMSDGADDQKQELSHLNTTGDPRLFKIPNDPRVTKVGEVLRKWSLDELPQLWNVLRGDMSIVGPRPFFEADLADYDDHHFTRLAAKPGITGLWQVKGRSSIVDFEEVVELDREYIERWSFVLDLQIICATVPAVLRRTGAF
jgi:exopolysaccharide biosynthesis polyprenyl glycosylphosphotransferase